VGCDSRSAARSSWLSVRRYRLATPALPACDLILANSSEQSFPLRKPVVYIVVLISTAKPERASAALAGVPMKLAGFLLLLAGWSIVLAAVGILGSAGQRTAFVLAGIGVEIIGLALIAHTYRAAQGERG